jgi:hypothetical protein
MCVNEVRNAGRCCCVIGRIALVPEGAVFGLTFNFSQRKEPVTFACSATVSMQMRGDFSGSISVRRRRALGAHDVTRTARTRVPARRQDYVGERIGEGIGKKEDREKLRREEGKSSG